MAVTDTNVLRLKEEQERMGFLDGLKKGMGVGKVVAKTFNIPGHQTIGAASDLIDSIKHSSASPEEKVDMAVKVTEQGQEPVTATVVPVVAQPTSSDKGLLESKKALILLGFAILSIFADNIGITVDQLGKLRDAVMTYLAVQGGVDIFNAFRKR